MLCPLRFDPRFDAARFRLQRFEGDGQRPPVADLAIRGYYIEQTDRVLGGEEPGYGFVDASVPDEIAQRVQPDDIATIVYTSGTTGPPKGCVTTHANCMATARMYEKQLRFGATDEPIAYTVTLAVAAAITLGVIILMAILFGAELGPKADPTTTTYTPRPEWYFFFLFELLRVVKPPELVFVATIGIPTICLVLLLFVLLFSTTRDGSEH